MPIEPDPALFRLLVIEDNDDRVELFRRWVPNSALIIHAKSGGLAKGLIQRDPGRLYGGVLLDHDLQEQIIATDERDLSGSDIANLLVERRREWMDVPILVHSTNRSKGPLMVSRLEAAGFWVTYEPMDGLTQAAFKEWIKEVVEQWQWLHL